MAKSLPGPRGLEPEPMVAEMAPEPEPIVAEAAVAAAAIDAAQTDDYPPLRVLAWEEDAEIALEPMVAEVAPEPEPEPVVPRWRPSRSPSPW